jgi:predicted tellurium resistance membrane protein TerC
MAKRNEGLGIIGAMVTVFIILGLVALVLNQFGWLPGYR